MFVVYCVEKEDNIVVVLSDLMCSKGGDRGKIN